MRRRLHRFFKVEVCVRKQRSIEGGDAGEKSMNEVVMRCPEEILREVAPGLSILLSDL